MSTCRWARRNVAGIVLNGGLSRRMGTEKGAIRLGGHSLLERTLDVLAGLFDEVLVVGRPGACPPHPALSQTLADAVPGAGPLGGIVTGLGAMAAPYGFVVACDMPCLDPAVVRRQLEVLRRSPADAVVPCWDGYWEPLHALYARACLPPARRRLGAGDRRIRSFFPHVRLRLWDVRAEGIGPRPFINVNTKSDLAALLGADP
ncbi:MAG: molybdenum cofactor guanylyltransferase [Candidatus Brocadiia bacterium]